MVTHNIAVRGDFTMDMKKIKELAEQQWLYESRWIFLISGILLVFTPMYIVGFLLIVLAASIMAGKYFIEVVF